MKILSVTACAAGVAHTFMAAESIEKAAKEHGHEIKVETQGAIGIENRLTEEEINAADAVLLTTDIPIRERDRFAASNIFNVSSTAMIKSANKIIEAIENSFKE
ncbi:PTS fructose transporter subunit IIB [Enterococcus sp. DIV0756]|uniref:PTS fructose transporter subunit IIB n=1 Tax=Enterococcus sp. DIV0756 TaxID=2774636 RepID=UPI003F216C3D